ncbi:hypothetical protein [Lactococcus cremoris]|uniref:Uncharacterized protein n=1 Tax=Lactococcus lactis subsp. cremoris TaxID=1359 RepID=A0A1V0PFN6_LACLC|nr:hypothetical protein [Lactococcus cremoris]ARE28051.1 hypothetical protein LLJM1_0664 [Lactococcus cremoris]EUN35615.1 hypothetical protein LLCHP_0028 [Lactococcus cremoris subsp. cremoris HP]KZK11322.1 hypothetical protein AB995_1495 [Lactococcus cremoris]KZK33557.1 hypothetical protein LMG6897_2412 [Lactococcus cremoris]KZK42684.1 hypothetical protein FG2_2593 [Lactococcus cremoris]
MATNITTPNKVSMASLIPQNALGTKFRATGAIVPSYKTIKDPSDSKKSITTDEIEGHYITVLLQNPAVPTLMGLPITVNVKGLLTLPAGFRESLIKMPLLSFENMNFGEVNRTFWVTAKHVSSVK